MPVSPRQKTPTFGARLVRALHMRVPEDPTHRHVQEAFSVLQVAGTAFIWLQAAVVIAWNGLDELPNRIRVAANVSAGIVTFTTLLFLTRRGEIRWAARVVTGTILAYQCLFAWAFGLTTLPSVIVLALPALAAMSLVETPERLATWGFAFGVSAAYGLTSTPHFSLAHVPTQVPAAVSAFAAIVFFTLYMLEYRAAMVEQVAEARGRAEEIAAANAELRAAIDERDRLAGRLATSQRLEAMGRVAGGIAHDFNNLLTVIRGYADLVTRSLPAGSTAADDARQLDRALARASRVSQEVLDFARPRPLDRSAIDLGEFVRELAAGLGTAVGARHPLLLRTGDGSMVIDAERGQVERLLVNLVMNARDASPAGAPIAVDVTRRDDRVSLVVSDRGPGVRAEDRERIFEPFYTTKGTTGGTGLGLATSFALMQQHGGTLRVEDAAGGGAAFIAEFPASRATRPKLSSSGEQSGVAPRGRPLDGIRALVVEDDAGVRRVATRFLQQAGAVVVAVEDGVQGVETIRASVAEHAPFQLVVSDLRLPQGSGADVLQAARAAWPEAALVAMSGFLEDDTVANMAAAQELVFVPKPFTAKQLVQAVEAARAGLHRE